MRVSRIRPIVIGVLFGLVAAVLSVPAGAQDRPGPDPRGNEPGLSQVLSDYARGDVDEVGTSSSGQGVRPIADSILNDGQRLLVYVQADRAIDAGLEAALGDAGAEITHVAGEYRVVTAYVAPADLRSVAAVDGVVSLQEALAPDVNDDGTVTGACPTGINSTADIQLQADIARRDFGVDGSGVTVGVLSDTYDDLGGAGADVTSNDLPGAGNTCLRTTAVNVLADMAGGIDEGRAMAQLVHDLAPEADLAFATAFEGFFQFADRIRDLRAAGADVIVDDITYFIEPVFQEGPISVAVDEVVADGAVYLSSAGNSNVVVGGKNVGSYEAPAYRPIPCPAALAGLGHVDCHDFDPGAGTDATFDLSYPAGGTLRALMQWAEPWHGVATDLDLYVLVSGSIALSSANPIGVQPFETVSATVGGAPLTASIVVARFPSPASSAPRINLNFGRNSIIGVEYPDGLNGDIIGPTIWGHNGAENALSLAATPYNDVGLLPETFSSLGPVTHYFEPTDTVGPALPGTGTPSAPLATPNVLAKPDITATDGTCTTFFGGFSDGCNRFFGTSAAAPHAAAVAALIVDAAPDMTPAQIHQLLEDTATPMNAPAAAVGAGRVDAHAALDALRPTAVAGTPGNGHVDLTWDAPANEPGTITGYRVRTFDGGVLVGAPLDVGVVTSAAVAGLTNGTTYTFTVAALAASGEVLESDESAGVVPAATTPDAPIDLAGTPGPEQVSLTWNPPADDGGSPITEFRVRTFDGGVQMGAFQTSAGSPAVITGLTNGTPYTFTVSAVNAIGEGPETADTGPFTPVDVPGAPTGVGATAGNAQATVSWVAPADDGGSALTGFRVRAFDGAVLAAGPVDVGAATTQTQVTGLTNGTPYTFTVLSLIHI